MSIPHPHIPCHTGLFSHKTHMGLLAGYCLAVASLTEPKNILTVVQGVIHICSNPEALNTFPFIPAFTPVTLEGPNVHRNVDTTPSTLGCASIKFRWLAKFRVCWATGGRRSGTYHSTGCRSTRLGLSGIFWVRHNFLTHRVVSWIQCDQQ